MVLAVLVLHFNMVSARDVLGELERERDDVLALRKVLDGFICPTATLKEDELFRRWSCRGVQLLLLLVELDDLVWLKPELSLIFKGARFGTQDVLLIDAMNTTTRSLLGLLR